MGKNKNRNRKQQQEQGMADRPAEQHSSMDAQSQAMRSEGSPSTARKTRQKSFGHN